MAAKPATTAPSYDPVKALEGMFNGAVTRMAYALKDPLNYGPNTKTVLTEVAKRFHDALDDCEVQLLDAKWYLEHHLALNKARREAKARELGTAVKRKHDELLEQQAKDETPVKKQKIENETKSILADTQMRPEVSNEQADVKEKDSNSNNNNQQTEQKVEPVKQEDPKTTQDDFANPSPQVTPAETNDFNFESMFGDAQNEDDNDDLGFNLEMDDSFDVNGTADKNLVDTADDPASLDALLPGLGDYANQAGETTTTVAADGDALPAFSNDFDLPEIGNDFDDFLNDETLGTNNYENNFDMDFDDNLFNS